MISATTRAPRIPSRPLPPLRAPSRSPSLARSRWCWSNGTMPNATPVTIVRAIANPTTRTSMDGVSAIGNAVGTRRERIGRVAAASARPSTPPVPVTTRLSVSSCRSTRSRPAPSAMRTAISRRRTIARASRRLVRFAHAINSTLPRRTARRAAYGSVATRRRAGGSR